MHEHEPRTFVRRQSLNEGWTFASGQDVVGSMLGGPKTSAQVLLPHDAMRDDRSQDALSGPLSAYHSTGTYRYEKVLDVPAAWVDKVVVIEFEGVFRDARVFINDVLAARHQYGYTGFRVPADAFLKFGERNKVAVEARTHLDSRWYSGGGIYRPVFLHVLDPVHIEFDGVEITTPDADAEFAVVNVATTIANATRHTRQVRLTTSVLAPDGSKVDADSSPVTMLPGQQLRQIHRLHVAAPDLWNVDSPSLYRAVTSLSVDDAVIDELSTTFGIRTLRLDAEHGLCINGEVVKLRGGAVHHDNGPLGAATIDRADERRVELLKAAGFNAIRSAHQPASRSLLEACDRIGMLVLNEAFDVWTRGKTEFDYSLDFPDRWREDLSAMVASSRNHPSVFMYSIGNEVLEIGDRIGANIGRQLADFVRAADPHRYVSNALQLMWLAMEVTGSGAVELMNEILGGGESVATSASRERDAEVSRRVEESAAVLDAVGYNYAEARYELDLERYPHRIVFGSETFPTRIAKYWELVTKYRHVIGDFTWTSWDYLGEVGVGSIAYAEDGTVDSGFMREYPHLVAEVGDLDITGFRRPISYYREIVYGLRRDPYIAVQDPARFAHTISRRSPWVLTDGVASWTWPGHEGAPVRVEVYADGDEVALFLDETEIARAPLGQWLPHQAILETEWRSGALTAVSYRGGMETGRSTLTSAQGDVFLSATTDRDRLRADHTDLAYVTIELCDQSGTRWTGKDREVTVTVDGPGVLAGLGTGDPRTLERFDSATRTTFQGRALAVIRPSGVGVVTVEVVAEGTTPRVLQISVIDADG